MESYLRDKGATFPEATTAPSTLDRLLRIVDVSHVIFEDAKLPQNGECRLRMKKREGRRMWADGK